jgi:excisionase family DNA binding protein
MDTPVSTEEAGMSEQPLLLRPEDAARILSLGRSKVFEMIASGELPSLKFGKSRRIPSAALAAWVEERTREAVGA